VKRLHVRSESRGHGLERWLALAVIRKARELGYSLMRLNTSASMIEEAGLYENLGFLDIARYEGSPTRGTRFFELDLKAGAPAG
jgi:ribosomal protein S18 acetylase RimI-like enzyme